MYLRDLDGYVHFIYILRINEQFLVVRHFKIYSYCDEYERMENTIRTTFVR